MINLTHVEKFYIQIIIFWLSSPWRTKHQMSVVLSLRKGRSYFIHVKGHDLKFTSPGCKSGIYVFNLVFYYLFEILKLKLNFNVK